MLKFRILIVLVIALNQTILSQDRTFEKRTSVIAKRIDSIILSEKTVMKKSLDAIEKKLAKKEFNQEEAKSEKLKVAEYHSQRINDAVSIQESKLQILVKDRVSGTLKSNDDFSSRHRMFFDLGDENFVNDSITGLKIEKRWTTQFVLAFGANSPLENGHTTTGNSFKTSPFGFGEFGVSLKYRIKEKSSLMNIKFGFSFATSQLVPERDNDIAVKVDGQTILEDAGFPIKKSRLTAGYMTLPVHFELDFSKPQFDKNSNQFFLRSQRGLRLGLGGFFGVRLSGSQFIKYNEADKRVRKNEYDDFNMNTLTFGPSAYIGYKDISFFGRYDANPLFKNNPSDIHNLAFGLRLDLN